MAHNFNNITKIPLYTLETIAAGGSTTSATVELDDLRAEGNLSIKLNVTGDGTVKLQYQLSDDTEFITPSLASNIISNFTKSSGTGGVDIFAFATETAPKMKIKITETGASDSVTVSLVLMVQ